MNRTKAACVFVCVAVVALLAMLGGGCGGKGGSRSSAPTAHTESAAGYGKVAAIVKLTPPAGRVAGAAGSATVTVSISISGVYGAGADRKEFNPVTTTAVIDFTAGPAKVSLLSVPIGVNHLLTVVADWGGATDTIKAIIPEVKEGEIANAVANPATTVVADAAMYFAQENKKRLYELPQELIMKISAAVEQMAASGTPYSQMAPGGVVAFMGNMGAPVGMAIMPASATVVVGGQTQFMAAALDANGMPVPAATASWAFSAPAVGNISNIGMFTGAASGSGVVTATFASFTATAAVTVVSVCAGDAVCNDNNPLTVDLCQNPGALSAQCIHNVIACAVDADCDDNNPQTTDACAGGGAAGAMCSHSQIVNQPPTASATADVSSGMSPLTVNFTGGCSDPDGTCVLYEWNFGDGSATGTAQNTTHIYAASGTFAATLIVTDNQGAAAFSNVFVTVAGNQAPAGNISADAASGSAPFAVNFTGGCADADGTCVSYLWDFGDGSPTISSQSPQHTFTATGTFTVTLTVTDNLGASTQQTFIITAGAANQAPAASAASNIVNGVAPLTVNFTGGCADADGTCVSYSWNFMDGSATDTTQNPSHAFTATGSFNVVLTVTDNLGATAQSAINISVGTNQLPAGTIGASPATGTAPLPVNFTGGCADADGTCVSYSWNFGDGSPTVSAQNASHTYAVGGAFTVTLTVTDNLGAATNTTTIINVNSKPVASASANIASGISPLAVNFTGGCTDADGTCASYSWEFGDGSATSTIQNATHTYTATGTFNAELMVTDNSGATATSAVAITVSANQPPAASATSNFVSGIAPLAVNFTGGCSDPDGTCVAYSWNFGDGGATDTAQNPSHTYTATGTFNAVLTVTDNLGLSAQSVRTITVAQNQKPNGSISTNVASGTVPLGVNFTGSCTDADGTCASYLWDFGDGAPTVSTQNPSHSYITAGSFVVTFTVTDNLGSTSFSTASINVDGVCGNGTLEVGEFCDDGNTNIGDGCSASCYPEVQPNAFTTCALNYGNTAGVRCWGNNLYGQIGDGTTVDKLVPTPVTGLSSGVKQLAAGGGYHECALMNTGGVKCWGKGGFIGDGTNTDRSAPTDVAGLSSGVKQISTGLNMTCALMDAGTVKCWGNNQYGQIGDGGTATALTPVDVTGLTGVAAIASGGHSSCVLFKTGGVKCWGENTYGEIGDGTTTQRYTPTAVTGLTSGAVMVSTGVQHACALMNAGGVKCWGDNANGQIGDGTSGNTRLVPTDVTGMVSGVTLISAAGGSSYAAQGGVVKGWGGNITGQLGDGTTTNRLTPVNMASQPANVGVVTGGYDYGCLRQTTGGIYCWGNNAYGTIGDGTTTNRTTPVLVNIKPAGTISTNVASGTAPLGVNFTGGCADADGTCVTYSWDFGDGAPTVSTQNTSHTYNSAGSFVVTFTVTDNSGASSFSTASISVASAAVCGNSIPEPGEECDDGNAANGDGCSQYCFSEIAVSMEHVCAINRGYAEGLECWGRNNLGQLGDGTTTNRSVPTAVSGLTSGVKQVVAGNAFACVLTTAGGVKCWGLNANGELGIGNLTNQLTPMDVTGLASGVKQISAGTAHVCAVMGAGGVKCWGWNNYGQLGYSGSDSTVPVDVAGVSGAAYVATGENFTCVLSAGGGVKCWGRGNIGSLGAGDWNGSTTPVNVLGLTSGVAMISTGSVSSQAICALTAAGGVKCWGENLNGGVGDGTTVDKNSPTDVTGLTTGMKGLGVGYLQSCGITTAGAAKCWGNNAYGTLGDGTNTHSAVPVNVLFGPNTVGIIRASRTLTGARTTSGEIYLWGDNSLGQYGNGTTAASNVPVTFAVTRFSTNGTTTCVVTGGGGLKCWGDNTNGQLGDGTNTNRSTPAFVTGLTSGVLDVSVATSGHTCALVAGGGIKCWGTNLNGELGDGTTTNSNIPVNVTGLGSGVLTLESGAGHTCALTVSGGLKCWGYNYYTEVGDGTNTNRLAPVDVAGLTTGAAAVAGRAWHSCAVTTGGGVKCWGEGYGGTPVDVTGLTSGVMDVKSGYNSDCALMATGGVKCWGNNGSGQLGDGTNTNSIGVPVNVVGLSSGVVAITMTWRQACALMATGGVKCWGENSNGQLGNGTTASSNVPVDVTGLTYGVKAIYSGGASPGANTCAVQGGVLKCWGYNYYGQLGDGTTTQRLTPVNVLGF